MFLQFKKFSRGWERIVDFVDDQQYKRQLKKDLAFLKSKGWKVAKNDFDIEMVKHPEFGMTTVERAMKGDYGNVQ